MQRIIVPSFIPTLPVKASSSLSSHKNLSTRRGRLHTTHKPIIASYTRGKAVSSTRVFLPGPLYPGAVHALPPEEAAHIRARRISEGAHVTLFDGTGVIATGLLGPDASVTVISIATSHTQTNSSLSALIALPKSPSRADWAVEKLVELGITRIHWVRTERVVAAIPNEARLKRWNRLTVSAAKQSMRIDVPSVESLTRWRDAIELVSKADLALLLNPDGPPILAKECMNAVRVARHVVVVVGPEGGLTDREEEQLLEAGAVNVGLGTNRLRVETAAVAAVAVVTQIGVQELSYERKSVMPEDCDVDKDMKSIADGSIVEPIKNPR